MGELDCTAIPISTGCISKNKNIFSICLLHSKYFAKRFQNVDPFLAPLGHQIAKEMGSALVVFWFKYAPGDADQPIQFFMKKKFPPKKLKHILAKIGQNRLCAFVRICGHACGDVLEGQFFQ